MKKITNKHLFIAFLILTFSFISSSALAKVENVNRGSANRGQANVGQEQAGTNSDQVKTSGSEAKGNRPPTNTNERQGKDNQINGEEHRSGVATFVQNLLNVADREKGGIGEQVRAIANAQNESKDKVANAIDKIKSRGSLKNLLVGTDYKNIGQLRSEMVKTKQQIDQLTALLDKTTNTEDKAVLQAQIQTLEQGKQKIDDFMKVNEAKFSLFGWVAKLLNK